MMYAVKNGSLFILKAFDFQHLATIKIISVQYQNF